MARPTRKRDPLQQIVRLLDKTTRVMQTMSMRLDVMQFGQRQAERRLARLERSLHKNRSNATCSPRRST